MMEQRKIGLVLDGGGGKGAYQIGVWKAMREYGLDKQVAAVAGTSVGGLNAALFVQGDFNLAYKIWTEEISRIRVSRLQMDLEEIINDYIDYSKILSSPINCYLAAHCAGQFGEYCECNNSESIPEKYVHGEMTYFNLRAVSKENCRILFQTCSMPKAVMLATSAMPILCRCVWINGKPHLDGGVGDNSPVYPLSFGSQCDTVIDIHLEQTVKIDKSQFPNVSILEIVPKVSTSDLGFINGTINFDPAHAKRLIEAGYSDGCEVFRTIYLNQSITEKEYIEKAKKQEIRMKRQQLPSILAEYYDNILGKNK